MARPKQHWKRNLNRDFWCRKFTRFCQLSCLLVIIFNGSVEARSDVSTVSFFKKTLSDPPSFENFIASSKILRERNPVASIPKGGSNASTATIYKGAKSGSNFFLIDFSDGQELIHGRFGPTNYVVSNNAIAYGMGSLEEGTERADRITQACTSVRRLTCQFLQNGLGDLKAGTLKWNGNEFSAFNEFGDQIFGRLEISNDLPRTLSISWNKEGPPFKGYQYEYPDPISLLNGYPEKLTILAMFDDGLQPFLELTIKEVRLVEALPEAFFDPNKFLHANITGTNFYTTDRVVSYSPRGTTTVGFSTPAGSAKTTQIRAVVWLPMLIALTIISGIVLLRIHKKRTQQHNGR